MMNKLKIVYAIVLLSLIMFINGCANPLRAFAKDVVNNYQTSIEKKIRSRTTLLDLQLMGLNKEMLESKYDVEKTEKIKAEIDLLHEEQRFLYSMNFEQFKLKYEIVEEYKNKNGLRQLIIKVEGKTHIVNNNRRSEIIDLPEEASYWLFSEFEYNGEIQFAGPLAVPEKKLKEFTEPKEKSPDNSDYTVTETTPSED